jgi:hypothetical protein
MNKHREGHKANLLALRVRCVRAGQTKQFRVEEELVFPPQDYTTAFSSNSVNITIEKLGRVPFCVLGPQFRERASWLKRHKTPDLSRLARKVHESQ